MNIYSNTRPGARASRSLTILLGAVVLAACEAPLDLSGVEQTSQQSIMRFDMYQDAVTHGERVLLTSSAGAALVSADAGRTWQRHELDGMPSLIDAAACPDGDFYALDSSRHVWRLGMGENDWQKNAIDTSENTLSLSCAPSGRLWVTAGFATLFSSDDDGQSWNEFSLNDDMQITEVQFIDEETGFAVGEFGLFAITTDGGDNWERGGDIPNEFYPMAAAFADADTGWVGGLDGVIWHTADGGQTWVRQRSVNPSPIYRIVATDAGVFAAGGSATLIQYVDGAWKSVKDAPHVPTYLRALAMLDDNTLLIAGGGGLVATVTVEHSRSVQAGQGGDA